MDRYLYKIRYLVDNTFARLKEIQGIFTRDDTLKQTYENSVALACIFYLSVILKCQQKLIKTLN